MQLPLGQERSVPRCSAVAESQMLSHACGAFCTTSRGAFCSTDSTRRSARRSRRGPHEGSQSARPNPRDMSACAKPRPARSSRSRPSRSRTPGDRATWCAASTPRPRASSRSVSPSFARSPSPRLRIVTRTARTAQPSRRTFGARLAITRSASGTSCGRNSGSRKDLASSSLSDTAVPVGVTV